LKHNECGFVTFHILFVLTMCGTVEQLLNSVHCRLQ